MRSTDGQCADERAELLAGCVARNAGLFCAFSWNFRKFGGARRNRTADKGFADLCLTTWRPRPRVKPFPTLTEVLCFPEKQNPPAGYFLAVGVENIATGFRY